MKKKLIGIVIILLIFSLIITYNHLQQPTKKDVFNITEKWSTSTEEVYLIREIDGKLLTIFRNRNAVMIAELQQNWFGTWKFRDNTDLLATYYPPEEHDKITWSALERRTENEANYYFGVVIDPEIDKINIETQDDFYEDVQFIMSEGKRFFFKEVDEPIVMPVNISGFSKSGELIYSSLKPISNDKD
jgi:hypothetical protein